MSGLKQDCACWDMSWGVTYAASAQCDSVRVTACQVSLCVSSQQACCYLHDNAPVHMSAKSQAAIQQCGFQQLNHPPYIPDLAPSEFFLFWVMKKFLRGKRFSSDEEVQEAVTTWFEEQSKDLFFQRDKVVATKVGEVFWVIGGLHWKIKNIFLR